MSVTAQWQHLVVVDGTGLPPAPECTARAAATFNLEPPKPLRVVLPRAGGMTGALVAAARRQGR